MDVLKHSFPVHRDRSIELFIVSIFDIFPVAPSSLSGSHVVLSVCRYSWKSGHGSLPVLGTSVLLSGLPTDA